jgi:hypothetical protein
VEYDKVVPSPIEAARDKSDAYDRQANGRNCWSFTPRFPDKPCVFGDPDSQTEVVLVGNSHAGQWLPTVQKIADSQGLKIITMLASQCALADLRQNFRTSDHATACLEWVHRTTEQVVDLRPDLVITTNRISVAAEGRSLAESIDLYEAGYESVLARWRDEGIRTLVLRDTPAPGFQVPDCVALKESDYQECDGTRDEWLPADPSEEAVASVRSRLISFADLTDHICGARVCSAVTGGVITYFDVSHLSATYATTLARYLRPFVVAALDRA